jgi:hypothetical protein
MFLLIGYLPIAARQRRLPVTSKKFADALEQIGGYALESRRPHLTKMALYRLNGNVLNSS